jgi:hypothetical protein
MQGPLCGPIFVESQKIGPHSGPCIRMIFPDDSVSVHSTPPRHRRLFEKSRAGSPSDPVVPEI